MTSPPLKLLSFDLTLRRKHSAGTSNVSGLPSREVEEKIGKSLIAGKLGWNRENSRLDEDTGLHLVLWKERAGVMGSSNHISRVEERQ